MPCTSTVIQQDSPLATCGPDGPRAWQRMGRALTPLLWMLKRTKRSDGAAAPDAGAYEASFLVSQNSPRLASTLLIRTAMGENLYISNVPLSTQP